MNINGVNYDSYLAELAQVQTISTQQTNVQSGGTESEKDSYISSAASADIAIPSGIYGADGVERTVDSVYGTAVGTQAGGTTTETEESGGVGGAGGGSSDSEETTETEIVTINGVTYLQTTTTDESGNTTVTRTQIGSADINNQ
jgi:hypothetical protein